MTLTSTNTTVSLQNNIRLRVFLVVLLSIGIRIAREFSSNSIHKATGLLEINFILYGGLMLCSLLPFKAAWIAAGFFIMGALVVGGVCVALGTVAVVRCLTGGQVGCVQTAPADIIALIFAALVVLLDLFQLWSVYLIVRFPSFVSSATQRIRILFSWALPFAWLVNIALLVDSSWVFWVTAHLVIDPTLIILATSNELGFLFGLMIVAITFDGIALLHVSLSLAVYGIWVQIILTLTGMAMLVMPTTVEVNVRKTSQVAKKEQPVMAIAKPLDLETSNDKNITRRRVKSGKSDLAF